MGGRQDVARGVSSGTAPRAGRDQRLDRLVTAAVLRAKDGDSEAFAFLYEQYAEDVRAYAGSIVTNVDDAEDITQQVFAKLLLVIGKYQQREAPFIAWIITVTRNVALDHLRRQRTIPVQEVRSEATGQVAATDRAVDLTEALSRLPFDQLEVVLLRHLGGLSPSEIATRTGRTESSVHGLHHRGRRSLRAELASRGAAPATARLRPAATPA